MLAIKQEPLTEPLLKPEENEKPIKFISVTSDLLTEEQRRIYQSVLKTWGPGPKQKKRHICQTCNKEFKTSLNLYIHNTRVHASEDSAAVCDICNKKYKNKDYLYMHRIYKHHSDLDQFSCQSCPQVFPSRKRLYFHIKKAHPMALSDLKCHECGKEFTEPSKLRFHKEKYHNVERYKCHICHKLLKNQVYLETHLTNQHTDIERHPCVFCSMTFKSRHHMKEHVRNVHPPLELKATCPECHKEFNNIRYLKRHMPVHSDTKPCLKRYKCDVRTTQPDSRCNNYVDVDINEHKCELCKKKFKLKKNLDNHVQKQHCVNIPVHKEIGEANYKHNCELCGKKFKLKTHLKKHLKEHEPYNL